MKFAEPTLQTTPTVSPVVTMNRLRANALTVRCPACGSASGERCHLQMPGWPRGNALFTVIYVDTPHKDRLTLAEQRPR